jgi:hypothetical protein
MRLRQIRAAGGIVCSGISASPAQAMVAWPVSPRVGNVKNNHPSLIEPARIGRAPSTSS